MASYRCILGYILNGVDSLTCHQNGNWVPAAPTCKRKHIQIYTYVCTYTYMHTHMFVHVYTHAYMH